MPAAVTRTFLVWRRRLKKILFAVVPAVVLLVGATVVLRGLEEKEVIDTHRPDDVVISHPGSQLKIVEENGKRYFDYYPPGMIRMHLPVDKEPNTWRAIVAGGSFAMGSPYVHQEPASAMTGMGGIPDWLGAELAVRFPGKQIQVVNAGAGGQNASRVANVVKDLLDIQPDLVIVATGNNEGYVPATPFNDELHDWIVYRAMKKVLIGRPPPAQRSYFTPQDDDTQEIVRRYHQAIQSIVGDTKAGGVPLMLCTLPINLHYVKTVQTHGQPIPYPTDDRDMMEGNRLLNEHKYEEAIEAYSKSENQAYAARFIAYALERLERYDEARDFYKIYVEHNPNNRMRPSFNEYLRQLAASEPSVHLTDLEKAMEDISEHGIPGYEHFLDYCHLDWKAYWEMSKVVVDRILQDKLIRGGPGEPKDRPTVGSLILDNRWDVLMSSKTAIEERKFRGAN
ncbi:MAG: hypothetical protein H6684_14390 [Deltaproteobacteria bacterium]|nr:hypothetical protein [bacterium]MCB9476271.1 hypothetical protein [Deltaproteobacteria bacterium]MCB9489918.1 hypothetical protein [Deltaproteobacteria bacterium]